MMATTSIASSVVVCHDTQMRESCQGGLQLQPQVTVDNDVAAGRAWGMAGQLACVGESMQVSVARRPPDVASTAVWAFGDLSGSCLASPTC